ncbi:MAG: hypothetical protein WC222_04265 [Parachlamydiales bacterium]|jgi:hypothetical protein
MTSPVSRYPTTTRPGYRARPSPQEDKEELAKAILPLSQWLASHPFHAWTFASINSVAIYKTTITTNENRNLLLSDFNSWLKTPLLFGAPPFTDITLEDLLNELKEWNPKAYFTGEDSLKILGLDFCKSVLSIWGVPQPLINEALTNQTFYKLLRRPPPNECLTLLIEVDKLPPQDRLRIKNTSPWSEINLEGECFLSTQVNDPLHSFKLYVVIKTKQEAFGELRLPVFDNSATDPLNLKGCKLIHPFGYSALFLRTLSISASAPHEKVIKKGWAVEIENSLRSAKSVGKLIPNDMVVKGELSEAISYVLALKQHDPIAAFAFILQICLILNEVLLPYKLKLIWIELFQLIPPLHINSSSILSDLYILLKGPHVIHFIEAISWIELALICAHAMGSDDVLEEVENDGAFRICCHKDLWLSFPNPRKEWNCINFLRKDEVILEIIPRLVGKISDLNRFPSTMHVRPLPSEISTTIHYEAIELLESPDVAFIHLGYCLIRYCGILQNVNQAETDLYCMRIQPRFPAQLEDPSRIKAMMEFISPDSTDLSSEEMFPGALPEEVEAQVEVPIMEIPTTIWKRGTEPAEPPKLVVVRTEKHVEGWFLMGIQLDPVADAQTIESLKSRQALQKSSAQASKPSEAEIERTQISMIRWKLSLPLLAFEEVKECAKYLLLLLKKGPLEKSPNSVLFLILKCFSMYPDKTSALVAYVSEELLVVFSKKIPSTPEQNGEVESFIKKITPAMVDALGGRAPAWVKVTEKLAIFPFAYSECSQEALMKLIRSLVMMPDVSVEAERRIKLLIPFITSLQDKAYIYSSILAKLSLKKSHATLTIYCIEKWIECKPKVSENNTCTLRNRMMKLIEAYPDDAVWLKLWTQVLEKGFISFEDWRKPIESICNARLQKKEFDKVVVFLSTEGLLGKEGYKFIKTLFKNNIKRKGKSRSEEELRYLWFLYSNCKSVSSTDINTFFEIFFSSNDDALIRNACQTLNMQDLPGIVRFSSQWIVIWKRFNQEKKWILSEEYSRLAADNEWLDALLKHKECKSIAKSIFFELLITCKADELDHVWNFYKKISKEISVKNDALIYENLVKLIIAVSKEASNKITSEHLKVCKDLLITGSATKKQPWPGLIINVVDMLIDLKHLADHIYELENIIYNYVILGAGECGTRHPGYMLIEKLIKTGDEPVLVVCRGCIFKLLSEPKPFKEVWFYSFLSLLKKWTKASSLESLTMFLNAVRNFSGEIYDTTFFIVAKAIFVSLNKQIIMLPIDHQAIPSNFKNAEDLFRNCCDRRQFRSKDRGIFNQNFTLTLLYYYYLCIGLKLKGFKFPTSPFINIDKLLLIYVKDAVTNPSIIKNFGKFIKFLLENNKTGKSYVEMAKTLHQFIRNHFVFFTVTQQKEYFTLITNLLLNHNIPHLDLCFTFQDNFGELVYNSKFSCLLKGKNTRSIKGSVEFSSMAYTGLLLLGLDTSKHIDCKTEQYIRDGIFEAASELIERIRTHTANEKERISCLMCLCILLDINKRWIEPSFTYDGKSLLSIIDSIVEIFPLLSLVSLTTGIRKNRCCIKALMELTKFELSWPEPFGSNLRAHEFIFAQRYTNLLKSNLLKPIPINLLRDGIYEILSQIDYWQSFSNKYWTNKELTVQAKICSELYEVLTSFPDLEKDVDWYDNTLKLIASAHTYLGILNSRTLDKDCAELISSFQNILSTANTIKYNDPYDSNTDEYSDE